MKLLLIEDDADLLEVTRRNLKREHFVVETAMTFREACRKAFVYQYDCILLDVMLPDGNGLDLLRRLGESGRRMPSVIVLSAKDAVEDRIAGLDLGADDYLPKPYHFSELLARLRSVVRRRHRDGEAATRLANVALYPDENRVEVAGRALVLSRKEYDILAYFLNRPGRLVEKAILAEAVWGDYIDQSDSFDFVYAQLKNLRKKLKEAGARIEIKTVYGFGYKIAEANV